VLRKYVGANINERRNRKTGKTVLLNFGVTGGWCLYRRVEDEMCVGGGSSYYFTLAGGTLGGERMSGRSSWGYISQGGKMMGEGL
jgi:hypothetical protein